MGRTHISTHTHPFCVSMTGADDDVRIEDLVALSRAYPFVEWAILYFPEQAGTPHNPTFEWRCEFAAARREHGLCAALHLCGDDTFRMLRERREDRAFGWEQQQYDRVQVNINGRARTFHAHEVVEVYRALWAYGARLILQRHDGSAKAIDLFLSGLPPGWPISPGRVSVLLDASCGKGISPDAWAAPVSVDGLAVDTGYAGGISPENIQSVLAATEMAVRGSSTPPHRYWLDMQSGVRTDNRFDLKKVERVLSAVARRMPPPGAV